MPKDPSQYTASLVLISNIEPSLFSFTIPENEIYICHTFEEARKIGNGILEWDDRFRRLVIVAHTYEVLANECLPRL